MKYLNKISVLLMVLAAGLFTACNTDQEGPVYNPQGQGLTFSNTTLNTTVVSPSDPTFKVDIFRSTKGTELTGKVAMNVYYLDDEDNPVVVEGCSVSDYTFAADSYMTSITVDVTPIAIGQVVNVDLALETEDVAINNMSKTTVSVSKDYTWVSLGEGYFADYAFFSWYDNGEDTDENLKCRAKVEIFEAQEDPGRYQIHNPYDAFFEPTWGADMDGFAKGTPDEILTVRVKDGAVSYGGYCTGMKYTDLGEELYLYPATAFGMKALDYAEGKTISLSPMYYMPESGSGFNMTGYTEVIVITLP